MLLEHLRCFAAPMESSPAHARIWLDWSTAVRDAVWKRYLVFHGRMLHTVRGTLERVQREGGIVRTSDAGDQARLPVGSANMLAPTKSGGSPDDKVERFLATLGEAVIGHRSPVRGKKRTSHR